MLRFEKEIMAFFKSVHRQKIFLKIFQFTFIESRNKIWIYEIDFDILNTTGQMMLSFAE